MTRPPSPPTSTRWARGEWDRFERTLGDRVSLALHNPGSCNASLLAAAGCSTSGRVPGDSPKSFTASGAASSSPTSPREQLALNRQGAATRGFAASVESWHQLDICDLAPLADQSFDAVVAFGGPLSYVLRPARSCTQTSVAAFCGPAARSS